MTTPDTSPRAVAKILRMMFANDPCSVHPCGRSACPAMQASALADALEAAPTWEERVERAGGTLFPIMWPRMTAKERAKYRDEIEPFARAMFPELAPPND